jgi:hypothetical protein
MKRVPAVLAGLLALVVGGCGGNRVEELTPTAAPPTAIRPPVSLLPTPEVTVPTEAPEAETPAPPPPTKKEAPRTRVPQELVGTWDGDRAVISFSKAGDVTVAQKRGGTDSGTVVIDSNSMELHLSGGVVAISNWEITQFDAGYGYEFFNLVLDGTSYVRDVPK